MLCPDLYLSGHLLRFGSRDTQAQMGCAKHLPGLCIYIYLLHLPEDDLPLPLNGAVVQVAGLQNVSQDGDGLAHILLGHLQN